MRIFFMLPRIFGIRPIIDPGFGSQRPGTSPPGSFVYVVKGDHGLAKIGITTNPQARLATLRTSSPFPIEFAYVAACSGSAIDVEQKAHGMLSRHRCQGEWFDVVPEVAVGALAAAANALGRVLTEVDRDTATAPPLRSQSTPDDGMYVIATMVAVFAAVLFLGWFEITRLDIDWRVALIANGAGVMILAGLVWLASLFTGSRQAPRLP